METPASLPATFHASTRTSCATRPPPWLSALRLKFADRGTFLTRIGLPPKRAFLFRTQVPFRKIVAVLKHPEDTDFKLRHRIEVLGVGQQVVVDGVHPDTRKPYLWIDGLTPWTVGRNALPETSEEEMQEIVAEATALLCGSFGFTRDDSVVEFPGGPPKPEKKKPTPKPTVDALRESVKATVAADLAAKGEDIDGDALLATIHSFLRRFISYPSLHASVAHTLWIAHTHLIDCFETTPRLALMSAEKESGKTRALEVTALLVLAPIFSISASPAVIVRLVSSAPHTILYDEIDGVFGNAKAQEANIDLRSVLNGGYRRGAKVHRCGGASKVEPEELDAFAAVAVAGLKTLPDTIASRSIFIHMRRRAPDEKVEAFRERIHRAQAQPIFADLAAWCAHVAPAVRAAYPDLPTEITDRTADCWEPLLAIADAAGGCWPELAREAAVHIIRKSADENLTVGVELLSHIKDAFGSVEKLWTAELCEKLCARDESPWKDLYGKEIDDRGLAKRLQPYGIKSKDVWVIGKTKKGYYARDFHDIWKRYLPPSASAPSKGDEGDEGEEIDNKDKNLALIALIAPGEGKAPCAACDGNYGKGCPHCNPKAYGVGV